MVLHESTFRFCCVDFDVTHYCPVCNAILGEYFHKQ